MIAGFMIWAGVAEVDQSVFCPNLKATGVIAAVAFASALLDHIWRAFFHVEGAATLNSLRKTLRYVTHRAYLVPAMELSLTGASVQGTIRTYISRSSCG